MSGDRALMADYHKLRVWQTSHKLVEHIYKLARRVAKGGEGDLARQMKRAAGSVPANIVEGSGHDSRKEFARFLRYAAASAAELEEHLVQAVDVGALYLWHVAPALERNTQNRKMLRGLIKRVDPDGDNEMVGLSNP